MALNPKRIQFFIDQIQSANTNTLKGIVSQVFEHLENEVKDNPVYDKYIAEMPRWETWPEDESATGRYNWELPGKYEDVKALSFALYKKLTESDYIQDFLFEVTSEGNLKAAIFELNKSFLGYFAKALDDIIIANPEIETEKIEKVNGDTVFIIHGHNELVKHQVQLLLMKAAVNNIVLHEQADKGRTIIDKLVEEGKRSNYAIALLTADDKLEDGKNRARQNVILEIGYFMGQLGKERVRLLVADGVEIPSDLQGILYEKYDASGAWKMKILKELAAVGIYVDFRAAATSL
ncbi:MAG TPA: nucleotide-binding protein [Flavisolibacter sp.]|jgi:predicted nucleotide-binding protein|nr:nucleotide-binding protein [Flavisolibacter sp.]